jgi:hypothetical protein
MGLFLEAFCRLYQKNPTERYAKHAHFLFNWLKENKSPMAKEAGWGYNFPWASKLKYLDKYSPTSVVTGFVCRGLFEYYITFNNPEVPDLIHKATEFILENIPILRDKSGICFSYSTVDRDLCYNASLLATEVLSYSYHLSPQKELRNYIDDSLRFVVSKQKDDGRWNYSLSPDTNKERKQIDFHQGFILDSLQIILDNIRSDAYYENIENGLLFYLKKQFHENGSSYYRLPKQWPVDIHNQAQGIITLQRFSNRGYEIPRDKIHTIIDWTVNNMYRDGHFIYQVHKYHKSISESKRHDCELLMSTPYVKSYFRNILSINLQLIIS